MAKAEKEKHKRFCRIILPAPQSADRGVAYIFLILAYPTSLKLKGGYEQYRTTEFICCEPIVYTRCQSTGISNEL